MPYEVQETSLTHYNFDGSLSGLCCFCAINTGIPKDMFKACYNCEQKESVRAEFARLYKIRASSECQWAALPAVVLDKIIRYFLGERLTVTDGAAATPMRPIF
jgi:hypothetical protein